MILNKYLSIAISGCLFLLMMLIASISVIVFFGGNQIPVLGVFFVLIFYFITKAFYNYLRNDDFYKNTKKHKSDKKGEKYWVKGEKDIKKVFIIVWVIVILILAALSLILYSYNNATL
ncbi:hypothetical protein [Methanobrevibacter sp.]|uniref:hypothetical protein n=1 Tax=Methanobrevibacter sp. TaxID=66852 RepID=UPI00388FCF06